MKKLLLILLCLPFFSNAQIWAGYDQYQCTNDSTYLYSYQDSSITGTSWTNLNTGQIIGYGQSLTAAPLSQPTDILVQAFDSLGQLCVDTLHINILQSPLLSTTGFNLCSIPIILTVSGSWTSYNWNVSTGWQVGGDSLVVDSPGVYYVNCMKIIQPSSSATCLSDSLTIYPSNVNTSQIFENTAPFQNSINNYYVSSTSGSIYNWSISPNLSGTINSGQGTSNIEVYWNNIGPAIISVSETDIGGCIGSQIDFEILITSTSIQEHSTNKELLKVTDLLGRETKQTNQPLFYLYDDGTVEKRIIVE